MSTPGDEIALAEADLAPEAGSDVEAQDDPAQDLDEPADLEAESPAAAPPEPETAFERRERLRAERHALVAALARRTGEPHRTVNARINRDVGARSVEAATDEQLEKAIRLLEREIDRRR